MYLSCDYDFLNFIIIRVRATGFAIVDVNSCGYKVLLLESKGFPSVRSLKSSKLIHGGVRYLEKVIK